MAALFRLVQALLQLEEAVLHWNVLYIVRDAVSFEWTLAFEDTSWPSAAYMRYSLIVQSAAVHERAAA